MSELFIFSISGLLLLTIGFFAAVLLLSLYLTKEVWAKMLFISLLILAIPSIVFSNIYLLGQGRPVGLDFLRLQEDFLLQGADWKDGEEIYLWLKPTGEEGEPLPEPPLYITVPWTDEGAKKLSEAMEAKEEGRDGARSGQNGDQIQGNTNIRIKLSRKEGFRLVDILTESSLETFQIEYDTDVEYRPIPKEGN